MPRRSDIAKRFVPTTASRLVTALLIAVASLWWIQWLRISLARPLIFDDAYMFYRYAIHIRQGMGMTWNLDGVHTYGETSPLWGIVVLLFSFLPFSMPTVLVFGSWICSAAALVAISWAVARNAKSLYLQSIWRVLPIVALPLVFMPVFLANAITGMETMMAVFLVAIFIGLVLSWAEGNSRSEVAALVGALLFLIRPEAALAIVVMPTLAWLLLPGITKKSLATLLLVFFACFALDLVFCKLYFGSPLPLSFYMKSRHGYEGYHTSWAPTLSALNMLGTCLPFLVLLAFTARRSDLARTIICLVPALLAFGYLLTITQIMGMDARYYVPYLAFFVVPALLALDGRLSSKLEAVKPFQPIRRIAIVSVTAFACLAVVFVISKRVINYRNVFRAMDRQLERRDFAYDPVHFQVAATERLPLIDPYTQITEMANVLLKPLPSGSTMTASEVGELGGAVPSVNIIDLAGLNDPQIALHGFDMNALLARRPDIIWMPHTDYTYQRGIMLSNPAFLQQYDLLVGAAGFGLALRKDTPVRPILDRQIQIFWHDLYPTYRMTDYLVQSTSWSGKKHRISLNDQINVENEKDQLEKLSQ